MRAFFKSKKKYMISVFIVISFLILSYFYFDGDKILVSLRAVFSHPFALLIIMGIYLLSFILKAFAWKLYLRGIPRLSTCLMGVLYSLFINHVLLVKAGDLVRIGVMKTREKKIHASEAVNSVIVLRAIDLASLIVMAFAGIFAFEIKIRFSLVLLLAALAAGIILLVLLKKTLPKKLGEQYHLLKETMLGKNGILIFLFTFTSWILEAAVVFVTIILIANPITPLEAVWVNSMTVAGQIFQITPGGLANYEAVMAFALNAIGTDLQTGYTIALLTHGIKFLFSYMSGAIVLIMYPIKFNTIIQWVKKGEVNKNEERI
ncbi:lysylphosphatidylglycerol synthase transmembrane domain-containing protein [Cytobacillus oceanisediminis]|uniref:lysylphosphatidylglycerol synthase transmembrane domain-containing protein n=1 Tax=Cytobacillus oceanisediminis TaxID=665099 RepID=UPI003735C56F